MDDAEFTEIQAWIERTPALTVTLAADLVDAIDPAVEPAKRFAAVRRALAQDATRALLYVTTVACGMVTTRFEHDPAGQAAYMRQLRLYAASNTVSDADPS